MKIYFIQVLKSMSKNNVHNSMGQRSKQISHAIDIYTIKKLQQLVTFPKDISSIWIIVL